MCNQTQCKIGSLVKRLVLCVMCLAAGAATHIEAQTNDFIRPTVVSIRAKDPIARETGVLTVVDPGVFTVCRVGPTNVQLTVHYVVGGTASNGLDYIRLPGAVIIPEGATEVDLPVYPLTDGLVEGVETVIVSIRPIMCIAIWPPPPDCYVVGEPSEATVYILDFQQSNQPPVARVTEPVNGKMYRAPADILIRAMAVDFDGCVTHTTFLVDGHPIGTVPHGCWETDPMQPVEFEMLWTNVPPGKYRLSVQPIDNLGACSTSAPVCVVVYSPDQLPPSLPPIVSIEAIDPVAAEGTFCWPRFMPCLSWTGSGLCWVTNSVCRNTATFVVRRTGPTNDALTVYYRIGGTASNGVDYVALPGMVTIQPGRRCAQIAVVPIDDAVAEPIETVVMRLVPSLLDIYPPPYYIGWPARAAAIIVDNDKHRPGVCTLPDRCFHVCWPATNGEWFRIECSCDLVNWTSLATNIVTEGAVHFVDPDADTGTTKFYRIGREPVQVVPTKLIE